MAHFRGTVQGGRGEASRLGHANSGLQVTCNGWRLGIEIRAEYDAEINGDRFYIYQTGGSNGGSRKLIAEISEPVAQLQDLVAESTR